MSLQPDPSGKSDLLAPSAHRRWMGSPRSSLFSSCPGAMDMPLGLGVRVTGGRGKVACHLDLAAYKQLLCLQRAQDSCWKA